MNDRIINECVFWVTPYSLPVFWVHLVSCSFFNKYPQYVCQISVYGQVLLPIVFWLRIFYCHFGDLNVCLLFVLNSRWHLLWFAFISLLANQVKSLWVILVRFSITSAVLLKQSSCSKNTSQKIMINKTDTKIEPCGAPDKKFSHVLHEDLFFYLAFDLEGNLESFSKQEVIFQRHVVLQDACSFAASKSWQIQ